MIFIKSKKIADLAIYKILIKQILLLYLFSGNEHLFFEQCTLLCRCVYSGGLVQ